MNEKELMLMSILQCERTDLYSMPVQLTDVQEKMLNLMQERRKCNEPLQYILGQTDFFGFKFRVDARVLIPRPETELLVEEVVEAALRQQKKSLRILEVGTGSGNIAVSLAKSLIGARIIAMDISQEALSVARENARYHNVAHQIDFVHCDFFEFVSNYQQMHNSFDMIISNPPYIATTFLTTLPPDVQQEPLLALDGGADGLNFYRALVVDTKAFLKTGGFLACEIGDGQKEEISQLLSENNFSGFYFKNDFRETPRYFIAHL